MNTKKIILVGDAAVGKSTFVKLLKEENFVQDYVPTLGVEVSSIRISGKCFNIWDCAGDERYGGLRDGYWVQAKGAIVMCDPTNLESIAHVEGWVKNVRRMVGNNVPIVLVINKSDMLPEDFNDPRFINISCKNKENIKKVLKCF